MDKTIRKFASFNAMKAEEYRAWQALSPADRLNAAAELSIGLYSLKEPSRSVPPDFKELLSVFNSRNVKYLLVGGYAVSLHAQPRATKDLDLWVSPDPANAQAVFSALAEFGAPLTGLTVADFMEPSSFFHMGTPPLAVDILLTIQGVDFEAAWQRLRGDGSRRERTPSPGDFQRGSDRGKGRGCPATGFG